MVSARWICRINGGAAKDFNAQLFTAFPAINTIGLHHHLERVRRPCFDPIVSPAAAKGTPLACRDRSIAHDGHHSPGQYHRDPI